MPGFVRSTKLEASSDAVEVSAKDPPLPSQTPTSPQTSAPPVLRNFSYPTNITFDTEPSPTRTSPCLIGPTTWDQRGVICSFSPNNNLRAGIVDLEDDNSYPSSTNKSPQKINPERYRPFQSISQQDRHPIDLRPAISLAKSIPLQEKLEVRRKQHTSCELTNATEAHYQAFQTQPSRSVESQTTKSIESTPSIKQFQKHPNVAARCRSGLLGHHRASKSLELSQLFNVVEERSDRPSLHSRSFVREVHERDSFLENDECETQKSKDRAVVIISSIKSLRQSTRGFAMEQIQRRSINSSEELRLGEPNAMRTRRSKDSKTGWLSHVKEWLSTSEPSTQALKNYKKEAFKRAGTTPDDPRATAKLHIPTATLPPQAIKPSGRGLDPEDVLRKEAERKKRLRRSFQTVASSSSGSRSSASRHSSLNSLPFKEPREDA
jgi:hypothetical protein